jgi:hypothetical protein
MTRSRPAERGARGALGPHPSFEGRVAVALGYLVTWQPETLP